MGKNVEIRPRSARRGKLYRIRGRLGERFLTFGMAVVQIAPVLRLARLIPSAQYNRGEWEWRLWLAERFYVERGRASIESATVVRG
jgi:hypothetical protein